ncbi:MAG TPA: Gx transporter family protein [Candidatus Eubacterium faecavium]|nr:Gx transporter family protein [Candidatus Eubacterium faecavium]
MNGKSKKVAFFALLVALAFVFSYLESLIPFHFGIPGIKLGLANLVVVTALYTVGEKQAFAVSVIRIILSGLTFGGVFSLVYSLAGGILSFLAMLIAKRCRALSVTGVSVIGGSIHNIGQLIAAAIVMETSSIAYYLPVLLLSGAVTGAVIGVVGNLIINRLDKVIK